MQKSFLEGKTASSNSRSAFSLSINKPFLIVWLALFIATMGIGMVSPLLPVFAESMGASGIWLGLAFSGFAVSQVPLTPVAGRLSDKFGKKTFLCFGLLIYVLSAVGYFWAPGYRELVIFRVFSGVGTALVIPTAFTYIGELAPRGSEGKYMGIFNIAMVAGFGIGPVLGGGVYDTLGVEATFVSMGMLGILGFAIVLLFLPRKVSFHSLPSSSDETKFEEPSGAFATIFRDATMQGIVAFQLVSGLLFGTVFTFAGIWMTTVIHTSVAQVGIVLSARTITNGILAYPFGWLADRMNRVVLVSVGLVMVAIGTLSIPWLGSFTLLAGLFVLIGIFDSMSTPSVNAMAVEKGRIMGMGSVMGVFNMAMPLGLIIGAIVGGVIESTVGIAIVFRFAAAVGLVGAAVFNVFMIRSRKLGKR